MAKVRVHQLAKELGLSSKEAIDKLAQVGVEVKSHSSTVEDEAAGKLRALVNGAGTPAPVAEPASPPSAKPEAAPAAPSQS